MQQVSKQNGIEGEGQEPAENIAQNMVEAFKEIARGEQTATAMESKLTSLEQRIDSLLAQFEGQERNSTLEPAK